MKETRKVNGHKIKPKVTAIIQARMQSKRLPGKALLFLAGKPILAHVIERTKKIEGVDTIVLATARGDENKSLLDFAESMEINSFVGSEENVLERYYQASEKFSSDYIVRITADNPFVDVDYASMIVDIALDSGFDYCALANLPLGTTVEVVKKEALDEAYKLAELPYHHEHVTPYIKEHPELFSIERPPVNIKDTPRSLRLTVDTPEDYALARILYSNLYNAAPFPLSQVIEYIEKNPNILEINKGIKQRLATFSAK